MIRLSRLSRLFRLFRLPGILILSSIACGQKGPPLAPIVYLPRAVSEVAAKRVENEVVLQFTVPAANTDGSTPADLRRIDVYAHTGPLPSDADYLKYGTLIASIDVQQPKPPEQQKPEDQADDAPTTSAEKTPRPAELPPDDDAQEGMVEQGSKTSVREALTPKHMEIGEMPPTRALPPPDPKEPVVVVERIETPGTVNFELPPQRFYVLFPISDSRNRRGPVYGPMPVMLAEPLAPPQKLDVSYSAEAIRLTWPAQPEDIVSAPTTVAAELPQPVQAALTPLDRETDGTIEFFSDVETEGTADVISGNSGQKAPAATAKPRAVIAAKPPAPRFGYNVYEFASVGQSAPSQSAASTAAAVSAAPSAPIAPLNSALLTSPGFADPRVEFGVERCYVVRRVEIAGAVPIESAPSAPACVTPVDTFPPAAPKSLAHISAANGVSLLWEANTEPDLGGYLVLRGEAPGDKLSPLTPTPIIDTSFLDTTARRGATYFYEVVAVDRSTPPNQSAPSNRVEETIR